MPQLDKSTFILQFLHLILFFSIIYISFEFFVLPKVFKNLKSNSLIISGYELFIFYQSMILNVFFNNLIKELVFLLNFLVLNILLILEYLTNSTRLIINTFSFNYNLNGLYYHPFFLFNSLSDILKFEMYTTSFLITERFSIVNFIK